MNKFFKYIIGVLFFALLLCPLILYFQQFGFCIWGNQEGWVNFGTVMSGIYSPIIAFLAFLIIVIQTISQNIMNKHQHDQDYISQALNGINFYLDLIDKELGQKTINNITLREELRSIFSRLDKETLNKDQFNKIAIEFHDKYRKIFDYWNAIYPMLMGLASTNAYPYEHNYMAVFHRIMTVLSYDTCVSLDKYHYCVAQGEGFEKYYFWEFRSN